MVSIPTQRRPANQWTIEIAETVLQNHITAMLQAAKLVSDQEQPLTLSIGSTPTARVIRSIKEEVASNITFEIHAGMYREKCSQNDILTTV